MTTWRRIPLICAPLRHRPPAEIIIPRDTFVDQLYKREQSYEQSHPERGAAGAEKAKAARRVTTPAPAMASEWREELLSSSDVEVGSLAVGDIGAGWEGEPEAAELEPVPGSHERPAPPPAGDSPRERRKGVALEEVHGSAVSDEEITFD